MINKMNKLALILLTVAAIAICGCVDVDEPIIQNMTAKYTPPHDAFPTKVVEEKSYFCDKYVITGKVISVEYRDLTDAVLFEDGVVLPCRGLEEHIIKIGAVNQITCMKDDGDIIILDVKVMDD